MDERKTNCALLADRHLALTESMRDLLESAFDTVFLVADPDSMQEGAARLNPTLIVVDLSLVGAALEDLLQKLHERSESSRVIVLTVHDQPSVAQRVLTAGADGVVLKRCIGMDLLPAVDAVIRGERFVSDDLGLADSAT